jgi:hypothetical protein
MGTGIANATQVGWGNQTPALQTTARGASGRAAAPRRRKRRKTATARAAAPRRRRRKTSMKSRLVKGSAAAKRYMAKIRRMRKR